MIDRRTSPRDGGTRPPHNPARPRYARSTAPSRSASPRAAAHICSIRTVICTRPGNLRQVSASHPGGGGTDPVPGVASSTTGGESGSSPANQRNARRSRKVPPRPDQRCLRRCLPPALALPRGGA